MIYIIYNIRVEAKRAIEGIRGETGIMTVMVVGLGSMGKRRIRLLRKYDSKLKIIGVDNLKERCESIQKDYGIITFNNLDNAINWGNIECAFISTSPLSHANLINICLQNKMHVFTELNLVDTMYEENMELAEANGKILFLSSTFLYRKEITFIGEKVNECKHKIDYTYHAGQYLPDWHPWESYKDFFVGQKKTNGCREFMAIEFPWLIDVFGMIKSVKVVADKISDLDVDYPDNYMLILEHENGNKGVVAIDIVSRKATRNLEVFGENIYLKWDGTPNGICWYDYDQKRDIKIHVYDSFDQEGDYATFIIEDAYYSEICNFFQVIHNIAEPRYTFKKDKIVLKIIDYIETGRRRE